MGSCLFCSLQISRYRRNISCPFAKRNRCNNRKTNKTTTGKYCTGIFLPSGEVFVLKRGRNDYTQPRSFRPISLMSFLLKTTERLIDRHIRDGTLVRYPLHANQHAYLAGKSTDTALHNLVSKITRAVHGKQYALGVFLDTEGAFNNASSGSLLNVLRSKRVSNTVVDWIKSMLSTRIARAASGDTIIEVRLHKGFPQGGVLSALMWILVADGLYKY